MAQPIYKLWFMKYKEPWYRLTEEERNKLLQQNMETEKQLGIESIITCVSIEEGWLGWGVEKYPDIEAVEKHSEKLFQLNWFEYFESKSQLGIQMIEE